MRGVNSDLAKIFISHSWRSSSIYRDFICLLNSIIGAESWINCSISREKAIDLVEYEREISADEMKKLEHEYYRVKARLMDPRLPKVSSRKVIRGGKLVDIETEGTILSEMKELNKRWQELSDNIANIEFSELERISADKAISFYINRYPTLCHAIEANLRAADVVFILLIDDVYLREWIDFELSAARSYKKPTFGVMIPPYDRQRYHDYLCDELIDFSKEQVMRVVSSSASFGCR